ncbi:MAG TPA: hypothetical protein VFK50_07860 [Sphingomicrobium sp.]|nr:hypothetical protein [Sphingomicrobium sp.]
MNSANILFIALGAIALVGGLAVLGTAMRGRPGERPRHAAMLIGGMMVTAFGMLMIAFAISGASAQPLNYGAAQ